MFCGEYLGQQDLNKVCVHVMKDSEAHWCVLMELCGSEDVILTTVSPWMDCWFGNTLGFVDTRKT